MELLHQPQPPDSDFTHWCPRPGAQLVHHPPGGERRTLGLARTPPPPSRTNWTRLVPPSRTNCSSSLQARLPLQDALTRGAHRGWIALTPPDSAAAPPPGTGQGPELHIAVALSPLERPSPPRASLGAAALAASWAVGGAPGRGGAQGAALLPEVSSGANSPLPEVSSGANSPRSLSRVPSASTDAPAPGDPVPSSAAAPPPPCEQRPPPPAAAEALPAPAAQVPGASLTRY